MAITQNKSTWWFELVIRGYLTKWKYFIFLIQPLLEARGKKCKKICWFYGVWENLKIYWPLKGPELITSDDSDPYSYKDIDYGSWTSIASAINSTTIIMIGLPHTVVCFNIKTNRWTEYPDFPYHGMYI